MSNSTANPGLEGVVLTSTRLSRVDGQAGELIIAGYPLQELALNAQFEETLFLLWRDRLPTGQELVQLKQELSSQRALPSAVMDLLHAAASSAQPPMDALRMAAGALSVDGTGDQPEALARTLIARFPTIVAAYWRLLQGNEPIPPHTDLRHAANYLYMLSGEEPAAAEAKALEVYLNTVVDHGLNASTFTARVITSTGSDLISAIVGAVGALKGPLHGGAPGPALDMVFEIGSEDRAESILREKLEQGERLMGFGHRVYKVRDPRAEVLSSAAEELFHAGPAAHANQELYELARSVERTAVQLLAEYKPGRNLETNVEYYTALLLHGLRLDTELFTPTFAIGRLGGWTAHCFEQLERNRMIRPSSHYHGDRDRRWQDIDARSG